MPFQSRWGYHPCSYADFLLIKELHWLAYVDLLATRRLDAWEARLPHNRVGPCPPYPVSTEICIYRWILIGYRDARCPSPNSDRPQRIDLPGNWRERLEAYRAHYGPAQYGKIQQPLTAQAV